MGRGFSRLSGIAEGVRGSARGARARASMSAKCQKRTSESDLLPVACRASRD